MYVSHVPENVILHTSTIMWFGTSVKTNRNIRDVLFTMQMFLLWSYNRPAGFNFFLQETHKTFFMTQDISTTICINTYNINTYINTYNLISFPSRSGKACKFRCYIRHFTTKLKQQYCTLLIFKQWMCILAI